jgi:hypothetical protein
MAPVTSEVVPLSPEALAATLGETAPAPRQLLRRLVQRLGPARCGALLAETLAVEAAGGCLRQDGQRRTVGGTFFRLAKAACTHAERGWIFFPPSSAPRAPQLPAVVVPSTWAGLAQLKAHIPRVERGGGTMKLTFVGVPGKLQHDRTCVLFRVIPTPAKGLPAEFPALAPGDVPPWTVVVPLKMWLKQKLPDIIRDHPTEKVLCEGMPVVKDGHCFLFATSVRSLWAERQRQEAQRATLAKA